MSMFRQQQQEQDPEDQDNWFNDMANSTDNDNDFHN
jgi:hypothetical protein